MKFRRHFRDELQRYYGGSVDEILIRIDARHEAIRPEIAFARTSSNPIDRRLEFCGYFLAAILEMEARGANFDQVRAVCVAVAESYVRPANNWQRWLKKLPGRLIGTPFRHVISRAVDYKMGKKGHPDGFLARVVTAPGETYGLGYGFDIVECGICTLFGRHNAAHYVPILCEVDRLTSALAGLELVRQGTIATGAARCDFRFRILR
jgi:hypothetical protein